MIPLSVSNPESVIKVRVITEKDLFKHTEKTLNKAGIFHIDHIKISEALEVLVYTSLDKRLHTTFDSLNPLDDIIIYVQAGKYTYLKANIKQIYSRPFRESGILAGSLAVKWN